jgi:hypothetical protein
VVLLDLVVRREAEEHLVDEDAERVPVDGFVVSLLSDDLIRWSSVFVGREGRGDEYLWREIVGSSAKRPCGGVDGLRKAEVGDLDVAIGI